MRPTFPELMQGLFYLALILVLIFFAAKAFTILDGIDKRQQQGTLHHEKLMAQHDAIMQRLPR
jgi:hypothetical protein